MSVKNAFSSAFIPSGGISSILRTTHACPLMRSATCSASVGRAITLSANAPTFFVGTAPRAWTRRNSPAQNFPSSFRKRVNSSFFSMSVAWSAIASRHFTPARSASSNSCILSTSVIAPSVFSSAGVPHQREARSGAASTCSKPRGLVELREELLCAYIMHHRALLHRLRRLARAGEAAVPVIFPEHLLRLGVRREDLPEDVVRPDRPPPGELPVRRLPGAGFTLRSAGRTGGGYGFRRGGGRNCLVQFGHHVLQVHVVPLARHPQRDRDLFHLFPVLRVCKRGEAVPHEDVHRLRPRGEDLAHPHVRVDLRRGGRGCGGGRPRGLV